MGDDVEHPPNLQNENPQIVSDVFTTVTQILQQYGWFIVFGCLVLLYIRSKVKPAYSQMKKRAEESRDKKIDPDVAQSRMEAMERARQRLQEEHDAKASHYAEKQLLKEEEKRQTRIEEWDNLQQGKAYRSKIKPREENSETTKGLKPKPRLRDTGYNPLMGGGGGGGSFRPSRRAGGGGGG
ncbi:selenoprotein S-like [Ylistrum balloti]|uniref:selenoprotein S-like n=1 Tax=Ylistrum balloti TaxID=509963 RepID=UPI002905A1DF|nr:selenoprotein S-like [Ylistrum balloti]